MKKLSKIFALLLVVASAFALTACFSTEPTTTAVPAALKDDRSYVFNLYKNESEVATGDLTRIGSLSSGASIVWTAVVTQGQEGDVVVTYNEETHQYTVDINEYTDHVIEFVLTCTISKDGETTTIAFGKKVEIFKVLSWEEYTAAIDDAKATNSSSAVNVAVKGVVIAMSAKSNGASTNTVYLQDLENKGGYYCYGLAADPMEQGLQIGMTCYCTGGAYKYSGTYEVAVSPIVSPCDETTTTITPIDLTEAFKAAETLKDAAITSMQGALVTLKGVEILAQDADVTSGYYKFKLGTLTSYTRISSSVCPLSKADQTTFIAQHAAKCGYLADVTGVLNVYDGAFYLTPITKDAYTNYVLPTRDDAGQVEFVKTNLAVVSEYYANRSQIVLPLAGMGYTEVTVAWALKEANANFVIDEEGKCTINVEAMEANVTEVTLVATITKGEATDTKEFTVAVKKLVTEHAGTEADPYSVEDAVEYCKSFGNKVSSPEQVYVRGVVASSVLSTYGDYTIWLKSSDGKTEQFFELYATQLAEGLTGDYSAENALAGKWVTAQGYATQYGETFELTKKKVVVEEVETTVYPTITAIADSVEIATTKITLDSDKAILSVGATATISYVKTPVDGTTPITWASSNTEIATVENGVITAVAKGVTTVKATVNEVEYTINVIIGEFESIEKFVFQSSVGKYEAYDATKFQAFLAASSTAETSKLVSHSNTGSKTNPLYGANGGSADKGTAWENWNILKLGSGSKASTLKLTFAEGTKITKVTVKATGWDGKNCTLTINGVQQAIVSHTKGDNADDYLTYEFYIAETNEITLTANLAIMISELEISEIK